MTHSITEKLLDKPICAFDIETVPDAQYGREHMGLHGSDFEVQEAMQARRREDTGGKSDFLPVMYHQVVTLSLAWWHPASNQIRIDSLGDGGIDEKTIITAFADRILERQPRLTSWNGAGFDLPVLQYRWLKHGIAAPNYWQPPNRYESYARRYSQMHIDLMDVLGGFRNPVKLDDAAQLCGFPGKVVTEGHRVFQHIARNEIELVQGYCEMDALNTLLLFGRWCVTRGELSAQGESEFLRAIHSHLISRPERPGWSDVATVLVQK